MPGALSLLELPAALRARGYDSVQLLYPHLESRDPAYLADTIRRGPLIPTCPMPTITPECEGE